jgi:hypothetical protein
VSSTSLVPASVALGLTDVSFTALVVVVFGILALSTEWAVLKSHSIASHVRIFRGIRNLKIWRIIGSIGGLLLFGAGMETITLTDCLGYIPQGTECVPGSGSWDAPLFNIVVAMALIGIVMVVVSYFGPYASNYASEQRRHKYLKKYMKQEGTKLSQNVHPVGERDETSEDESHPCIHGVPVNKTCHKCAL